ncbi:MAG TPA: GNAT family N-acetyltransferase [Cyclobacteriaceae bacterium]
MTVEKLVLKACDTRDAGRLATLAEQAFYETYKGLMPERDLITYIKASFTIDKLYEEISAPTNLFTLAFYEGTLVGYSKLDLRGERTGLVELERLYLLRQYCGFQIGKNLMIKCIADTYALGYEGLWLVVWERNEKAISFYEQWGFSKFDTKTMMRGNDPQIGILMKKMINQEFANNPSIINC